MTNAFRANRAFIQFMVLVSALSLPALTWAWGSTGHRMVGAVADAHLTVKARIAVRRIMDNDSLASVASWMDEVRGTSEGKKMKPWHFDSVDVCNPAPAACANDNCASKRIEMAIQTLRTGGTQAEKLKALRVLVHLVGDIHQPLHTAENGDTGGNFVTLRNRRQCIDYDTKQPTACTLHQYWDNVLVQAALRGSNEKKLVLDLAEMTVGSEGNASAWVLESNLLAKNKVHVYQGFACKAGKQSVSIDTDYDKAALPVIKEQLARAGQRLASVLNDIYK